MSECDLLTLSASTKEVSARNLLLIEDAEEFWSVGKTDGRGCSSGYRVSECSNSMPNMGESKTIPICVCKCPHIINWSTWFSASTVCCVDQVGASGSSRGDGKLATICSVIGSQVRRCDNVLPIAGNRWEQTALHSMSNKPAIRQLLSKPQVGSGNRSWHATTTNTEYVDESSPGDRRARGQTRLI